MNNNAQPHRNTGRRLSISTWSLHRSLGVTFPDSPGDTRQGRTETWGAGNVELIDIPQRIAQMGIHTLEICHFQMPSREDAYLNELRHALAEANVELLSLLIDTGDITHPVHGSRDLEWALGWVETAGKLGAKRARVIAGQGEPTAENLETAYQGVRKLADFGKDRGVRITTENWFPLLSRPEDVSELLDRLEGDVGLNFDFGNWGGATKYEDLAAIAPYAESCHAKCAFSAPQSPNAEDYGRCFSILDEAAFAGPYTLIYDGPSDDEWAGLEWEAEFAKRYLPTH